MILSKRIGVFTDIHGNLQALESVLDDIKKQHVDAIYCCGDIVGYGANPNECVERVRELNCPTVVGNHDHASLLLTDTSFFNEIAKKAVLWTKEQLTEDNIEYLKQLPMVIRDNGLLFVHASPKAPEEWNYILTMGEARTNFDYFTEQMCFLGHTHQPFIVEKQDESLICPEVLSLNIHDHARYIINAGSVGQPRDRNPLSSYVICNFEQKRLEIHRVQYDITLAQAAIIEKGLPIELAQRLAYGW